MRLPAARGSLSEATGALLAGADDTVATRLADVRPADPLGDDDLHLALAMCYELHYGGFDDVDDDQEWNPAVIALRGELESAFEAALREAVRVDDCGGDIDLELGRLVDSDDSPPLSSFLAKRATVEQYRDFVTRRSIYHLKEADPHTWVIPRVVGATKAALVEIQADEYGGGRAPAMHSALFAKTMRALGLDDSYGAYWADADGPTFAVSNLMSMFGLQRRLRGAALGHLAAFEMTSTSPNRRYGNGLRRLGFGREATEFFDVHVEADAVHEQLAAVDMCGSFVEALPQQRAEVLFGAACALELDRRFAESLVRRWNFEPGPARQRVPEEASA
jgi:hypothetical protein